MAAKPAISGTRGRKGTRSAAVRKRNAAAAAASMTLPTTVIPGDGAPPLPRTPGALARRFQQVCATMIGEAIAGEDVVQLEYGSLIALEIEPGVDQRRLADAMGIDPSNASLIIDRLHAKGLILRRTSGSDRRSRELYLTAKGKALWRRLRVKSSVANAQVLEPLAPHERELFLDLLIRVIQGNWTHARPGAGRRKRSTFTSTSSKK
jgi:DNA-binding MarR family transcriptional regulator